jgi:hypothetical protein
MILDSKQLADVSAADIQALLDAKTEESKRLDYKRDLPGSRDGDKKEFLFDVSSFANASGGHLVYGIDEHAGVPTQLTGLAVADADAEILRLQSAIQDGIEPRIPGMELRFIPIPGGRSVLVLKIPKSWVSPHMVSFQKTNKFYSRNAAGKYLVDVGELRALFSASEETSEHIRRFRTDRVAQILAGEAPCQLSPGPKIILHVAALQSFYSTASLDIKAAKTLPGSPLLPLGAGGYNPRINLDGLLHCTNGAYLQLFRRGVIETVDANTLDSGAPNPHSPSTHIIPSTLFERSLLERIPAYLTALKLLGLNPPFVIMATLSGVKGFLIATRSHFVASTPNFDRDLVSLPEVVLEKSDCNPPDLKPLLDAFWNAGGIIASPNFDSAGNWHPQ